MKKDDFRKIQPGFQLSLNNYTTAGYCWDILTQSRFADPLFLERYGYKAYSQNDEDGIIAEIFRRIGTTDKRFIEFGVQNGLESNTHYLLFKDWQGLWIEGSSEFYTEIQNKFRSVINSGQLAVQNEFITRENINKIFHENGFHGEIDLLSIDIDGNDYHVWKAVDVVSPRVVVIEYNAKFPPDCDWHMPYREHHVWDGTDRFSASLKALERLGGEKGYQLVGTNISGVNAFFVRRDLAGKEFSHPPTAENLYNPCRYGEIRFVSGHPPGICVKNLTQDVK